MCLFVPGAVKFLRLQGQPTLKKDSLVTPSEPLVLYSLHLGLDPSCHYSTLLGVCVRSAPPKFYGHSPFPSLFVYPIEASQADHILSLFSLLLGSTERSLIDTICLGRVWLRV